MSRMKYMLATVASVSLLLTSNGFAKPASPSTEYTNESLGITLKGPAGWTMNKAQGTSERLVNFTHSDGVTVMGLQSMKKRLKVSLKDYAYQQARSRTNFNKGLKTIAMAEIKSPNVEFIEILYEISTKKLGVLNSADNFFYDSKRGVMYVLTLITPPDKYAENQRILNGVMKSIKIK